MAPFVRAGWAVTTLLVSALDSAILGLSLSSLWAVLRESWPPLGEPDSGRKTAQIPKLLALLTREPQHG